MADWYSRHLGFHIIRQGGSDSDGGAFIVDECGYTVLEIFRIPDTGPLPLRNLAPIQLHIAIDCDKPYETAMALVKQGAEFVGEAPPNDYKGEKLLVRDPWGLVLQLVNRETKLDKKHNEVAPDDS
jgi:catechol 2,3-dioxygenase-like lactoylglutathione lyase family enzyme